MRCVPFPQNFGKVEAQITLYFIKNKRISFIVTCVIVLVYFGDQTRHGRGLKLEKKVNSKYFLPLGFFSPSFVAG